MANTYKLIASTTLGSNNGTINFASIPATYTDLVLRYTARLNSGTNEFVNLRFNGNSSSIYSETLCSGQGTTAFSERAANFDRAYKLAWINGGTSLSNTFTAGEIYIPSYLLSQNKPWSTNYCQPNNNTTNQNIGITADYFRSTSAISSIVLTSEGGTLFVTGSSFFLYGIYNS